MYVFEYSNINSTFKYMMVYVTGNPVPGLDMPEHRAQLHSSNFPRSYNNNENCNFTKTSISGDEEEYLVMFHTFKVDLNLGTKFFTSDHNAHLFTFISAVSYLRNPRLI